MGSEITWFGSGNLESLFVVKHQRTRCSSSHDVGSPVSLSRGGHGMGHWGEMGSKLVFVAGECVETSVACSSSYVILEKDSISDISPLCQGLLCFGSKQPWWYYLPRMPSGNTHEAIVMLWGFVALDTSLSETIKKMGNGIWWSIARRGKGMLLWPVLCWWQKTRRGECESVSAGRTD